MSILLQGKAPEPSKTENNSDFDTGFAVFWIQILVYRKTHFVLEPQVVLFSPRPD